MPFAGMDPEDIIFAVLGYALGGGTGGAIDVDFRLNSVEQPGSPPWLKHTHQRDKYSITWSPGKQKGKLVFWRQMKGDNVEWVEITLSADGIESTSATSGKGTNKMTAGDPAAAGTLPALGKAWGDLARDLPDLVGPGHLLDAQSIKDMDTMFATAAAQFDGWHAELAAQIAALDQDDKSFRGSASEAYVQRIQVAMVKVDDAKAKADTWKEEVQEATRWAGLFSSDVIARLNALHTPGQYLLEPWNYLINMLNQATLTSTYTQSSSWDTDRNRNHDFGSNGIANASDLADIDRTPTILMSFPGVPGGPWDVFRPSNWLEIDTAIKSSWVAKIRKAFTDPVTVPDPINSNSSVTLNGFGDSADKLGNAFTVAAQALIPPKIQPNPKPRPPAGGGGGDIDIPDSGGGGDIDIPDSGGGGGDIDIPDSGGGGDLDIPDSVGGGGDLDLPDSGGGGGDLDIPVAGGGGGLPTLGSTSVGTGGGGPLLGANGSPATSLGDLSPEQLSGLQGAGALDDIPLTDEQLADLAAAGMPAAAGSSLGDLSPAQLGRLQSSGLLDDEALTPSQSGLLDDLGLGDGTASSLGDLTPEQLGRLSADGLLDDIPLTDEQIGQLQEDGLLGTNTAGIDDLGDLSSAQLQDLQQAGLLDDIELTDAQRTDLGMGTDGLDQLSGTGGNGLGVPTYDYGVDLPSSQFPTAVDGLDITPVELGSTGGFPLGDVTQPLAHSVMGGTAGVSGGGLGSGALTGSGTAGSNALSDKPFGQTSALTGTGVATDSTRSSGAPFMPPMGGGMGGGGEKEKSRSRNTWLTEDEDVWGTDPDCAPAVIGRGDESELLEPVEGPSVPVGPRPVRPGRRLPGRGQG